MAVQGVEKINPARRRPPGRAPIDLPAQIVDLPFEFFDFRKIIQSSGPKKKICA